jgi:hypothetical protein
MTPSVPNPFEVLRLDPATPSAEVVRIAGRLRQQATDAAAIAAIRQAVQALAGAEEERRLHELCTHARPCYEWPGVEQFIAAFRRPPQPAAETAPTSPPVDVAELAATLPPVLAQELATAHGERDQIINALWRSLLIDMRA